MGRDFLPLGGAHATETQPPVVSATRAPVLIVVGNAAEGGGREPGSPRIIDIGAAGLDIGRNPVGGAASTDSHLVPWSPSSSVAPRALETTPSSAAVWRLLHRRASGRHARIQRGRSVCVLDDLGSTNGTLINGRLVTTPTPLADGDVLFVGGHAAVFRWLSPEDRALLDEAARAPLGPFATASPVLAAIERKLRALARSEQEILLVGETGVGKEVYADALHRASGRAGPLVTVNCAALPHELVESELFGYARGAHSQASMAKRGFIEEAEHGTLFLDELGDMPHAAQAKLLRFLQTRELIPLGMTRARKVDVRVLAATSRPGGPVAAGDEASPGLRQDLVGRMGAASFTLPPLRARREDIGDLLARLQGGAPGRPARALDPTLFLVLCLYSWPRNVRELKKVIETAALLSGDAPEIGLDHVPPDIAALVRGTQGADETSEHVTPEAAPWPSSPAGARVVRTDVHRPVPHSVLPDDARTRRRSPRPLPPREQIIEALRAHNGNLAEVARALDRDWKVMKRALERYGINADEFRGG